MEYKIDVQWTEKNDVIEHSRLTQYTFEIPVTGDNVETDILLTFPDFDDLFAQTQHVVLFVTEYIDKEANWESDLRALILKRALRDYQDERVHEKKEMRAFLEKHTFLIQETMQLPMESIVRKEYTEDFARLAARDPKVFSKHYYTFGKGVVARFYTYFEVMPQAAEILELIPDLYAWLIEVQETAKTLCNKEEQEHNDELQNSMKTQNKLKAQARKKQHSLKRDRSAYIDAWAEDYGSEKLKLQIITQENHPDYDYPGWPLYLHERIDHDFSGMTAYLAEMTGIEYSSRVTLDKEAQDYVVALTPTMDQLKTLDAFAQYLVNFGMEESKEHAFSVCSIKAWIGRRGEGYPHIVYENYVPCSPDDYSEGLFKAYTVSFSLDDLRSEK
jgi:hypothetical protein